jgi:signal transduction histidine kinase
MNISTKDHKFTMTIEDDGVGFDTASAFEPLHTGRGLGVLGMRERAVQVNGIVEICSRPGEGTIIQCTVPLAEEG